MLAADLDSSDENISLIKEVSDLVDVIKISNFLVMREGFDVIKRISDISGKPIFADLKIADVPHTNRKIVKTAKSVGTAAVMVHGFLGPDSIEACLEEAGDEIAIFCQVELTSPGGKVFNSPISKQIAEMSSQLGVHGIQVPGNRVARIKEIMENLRSDLGYVSCGIGKQGGSFKEAIDAGVDFAIIGRAIYASEKSPREAAQEFICSLDDTP